MPKQGIIFAVFLGFLAIVAIQTHALELSFFVLFPATLYPVFYFFDHKRRGWFYISSILVATMFYTFYSVRIHSLEILILGILMIAHFCLFAYFRKYWEDAACKSVGLETAGRIEFDDLQEKHSTRLLSLRHLERQVTSLLDLFELARDFSDCLSMSGIADLLHQKVMPELPFEEMKIIQIPRWKNESDEMVASFYIINHKGITKIERNMEASLLKEVEEVIAAKKMAESEQYWMFPLIDQEKERSAIAVSGANREDMAKFEVLVAYLALQVQKVKLYETVRDLSIRDELTGVFVRRHFLERFEEEIKRAIKHELPMAVLMLDIDHFKRYNDTHGHLAGDGVLRQVTQLIIDTLRKVDVVSRYGGEEFVVVLPESTEQGAYEVAERIRSAIARNHFKIFNEKTRVTVSIGVSFFPIDVKNMLPTQDYADLSFELIQKADKALYRAKEEGRNRVIKANDL